MALWLELEQQLPTWLSSEGGEERKRRSSRDGVVYAMAPRLVLRIAAGRSRFGRWSHQQGNSQPIEEYQGQGAILAPAARNAAAAARNKQDKCDKYKWGGWVMLTWP
jgi:hypothetical protein